MKVAEGLAAAGRLAEAADALEEAFNKSPSLREKYSEKVRLWRDEVNVAAIGGELR